MSGPILAVDSSNNRTTLALVDGETTLHHACCSERDNLGWLRQQVSQALDLANLDVTDIQRFAVSSGPGALTGVRVGVGFVQAMAQAVERPVVGVNTLAAMAWQLCKQQPSAPTMSLALDARMNEIYVAQWAVPSNAQGLLETNDRVISAKDELAQRTPMIAAGPGWEAYAELLPPDCALVMGIQPDALDVAQLARVGVPAEASALHVHYLRREVAKVPERLRTARA